MIVRGLPTVLQRWHGRGFGMDLQDLLAIIKRTTRSGPYSREYHVRGIIFLYLDCLIDLILERKLCGK